MMRSLVSYSLLLAALFVLSGCTRGVREEDGIRRESEYASIRVVNMSNESLHHFYLSPTKDRKWGPDLLGASQIVRVGQRYTITNIPVGSWDIRIVDASGHVKEWYGQNFRAGVTYTLDVQAGGWSSSSPRLRRTAAPSNELVVSSR